MSRSILAIVLALCLGLAVTAGCGQKGDLYLEPGQAPETGEQERDDDDDG